MVVDPLGRFYFCFIEISMVDLSIGKVMGLVIRGVILMGTNLAVGFFELFL